MGGPVGILTGTEQKKPSDATETSHSLFHTEAGGHASSKPAGLQIRICRPIFHTCGIPLLGWQIH